MPKRKHHLQISDTPHTLQRRGRERAEIRKAASLRFPEVALDRKTRLPRAAVQLVYRGRGLARGRTPGGGAAPPEVERFDRRVIEPFELFRSEFGQRCVRIQEFLLEFIRNDRRNPKNSGMFNIFYNIWRNSEKF